MNFNLQRPYSFFKVVLTSFFNIQLFLYLSYSLDLFYILIIFYIFSLQYQSMISSTQVLHILIYLLLGIFYYELIFSRL